MTYISKSLINVIAILLSVIGNVSITYAEEQKKETPLTISGTTKVNAEGIFELLEKAPDTTIIDARISSDRIQGYIEGSISLPDVDTNCSSLKQVVPSLTAPVLFYCNGVKCGRSGNAAEIAVKCGYNNIYWFRGGFEEWKAKNLPFLKG